MDIDLLPRRVDTVQFLMRMAPTEEEREIFHEFIEADGDLALLSENEIFIYEVSQLTGSISSRILCTCLF